MKEAPKVTSDLNRTFFHSRLEELDELSEQRYLEKEVISGIIEGLAAERLSILSELGSAAPEGALAAKIKNAITELGARGEPVSKSMVAYHLTGHNQFLVYQRIREMIEGGALTMTPGARGRHILTLGGADPQTARPLAPPAASLEDLIFDAIKAHRGPYGILSVSKTVVVKHVKRDNHATRAAIERMITAGHLESSTGPNGAIFLDIC